MEKAIIFLVISFIAMIIVQEVIILIQKRMFNELLKLHNSMEKSYIELLKEQGRKNDRQ